MRRTAATRPARASSSPPPSSPWPPAFAAPAAAVAPDTLFPAQGNAGYDVEHYDVRLDYVPATNHLAAVTTLRGTAASPLSSFHLDLSGMTVSAVSVDGRPATWRRTGPRAGGHPRARRRRSLHHDRDVRRGTPRAHRPGRVHRGLGAHPRRRHRAGEPVGAMTWLPSDNTPADKATFAFDVRVPRGFTAAANGDLVRKRTRGSHTRWVWRSTDPMSTYLATVSIGRFDVHRSSTTSLSGRRIPIWSFIDPTSKPTATARGCSRG